MPVYCKNSCGNSREKNNIKKTALITVGEFLGDDYSLSKLYDSEFETEFRKVKRNDGGNNICD